MPHSLSMWLIMPLGAKTGQRLMNSNRDTHLYSSFCTCTNGSFRCISHFFIQNCIKFLQFSAILKILQFLDAPIAVYMALRAITGQRLMNFHSKLLKSPSIYISSIKYYSFDMFLLTCRSLATKKGQTLTNSERDTHLYSYFCTCTNMSFRCISILSLKIA